LQGEIATQKNQGWERIAKADVINAEGSTTPREFGLDLTYRFQSVDEIDRKEYERARCRVEHHERNNDKE
jgi:hypothetical protein